MKRFFCFPVLAVVPTWPHAGKPCHFTQAEMWDAAHVELTGAVRHRPKLARLSDAISLHALLCDPLPSACPASCTLFFLLFNCWVCDALFGAGVHQFVMLLNEPVSCCCGLWVIIVVSVGYLDISLFGVSSSDRFTSSCCFHAVENNSHGQTYATRVEKRDEKPKTWQVCVREDKVRRNHPGMWDIIFCYCWHAEPSCLTSLHTMYEKMGNLDVNSSDFHKTS